MPLKLAFIGFGEAGRHITAGIRTSDPSADITVWDVLFSDPGCGETMRRQAAETGLTVASGPDAATQAADVVISAVTTDQSLVAAEQLAPTLASGTIYLDLNSTSPGKKRKVADVIDGTGAHMVEAAVMDTVPPHGHRVPMLLAGRRAHDAVERLAPFDMRLEAVGTDIGQASTIKMCRSVFMKGLPAILYECLVAAEAAGVTRTVLDSLGKTYPGLDWEQAATRALAGTALHAGRRAGEMRECAITVEELGVSPTMALATADRLQAIADLGLRDLAEARHPETLQDFLDDVKTAMKS